MMTVVPATSKRLSSVLYDRISFVASAFPHHCILFSVLHQFLTPSTAITILPHYSTLSTVGLSLTSELFLIDNSKKQIERNVFMHE